MNRSHFALITLSLATALAVGEPPRQRQERQAPPARPALGEDDLIVHEWGTYTSVQGSDGRVLEGLHHEDEPLPAFVHGRDELARRRKSIDFRPMTGTATAVTQRLETPVLFFHSGSARRVSVDVRFPDGILSQWYPQASFFLPRIGQVRAVANGLMTWEVNLLDRKPELAEVPADDIWAPSRNVQARYLSATNGDETEAERFIFYRGVARFDGPVSVTSNGNAIEITNRGAEALPAAFLLDVRNGRAEVTALGALQAGASRNVTPRVATANSLTIEQYLPRASAMLKQSLVASGLYDDEAQAMVDTWRRSYFRTPGLRLLYIAPRNWADRALPLDIHPEPTAVARTFVGRIEILTAAEEQALIARLPAECARALQPGGQFNASSWTGPFAEAKLQRLFALVARAGGDRTLGRCVQRFIQALN